MNCKNIISPFVRHGVHAMSKLKASLPACLLLLISFTVQAQQTYPIYVSPSLTLPYSLILSDYAQPGSQRLVTTILVNDLNISNLPVRLHLKIESMTGIVIETMPNINTLPVYLNGGEAQILFGDDMADYFNLNNLLFMGFSKDEYRRTGQLPEGFYRFSVEVHDYATNRLISNVGTTTAWMALGKPPVLKTPDDKSQLGQIAGMPFTFSWVPSSVGVPNGGQQYTFELWEMRVPGIDPNVVTASMQAIYSTTQMNTSLVVQPAELLLEPGMTYVWRVTVSDINERVQYDNRGRSEVRTFVYQCGCDAVTGLSASLEGGNAVFRWNSATAHTGFNVETENPATGWSKKEQAYDTRLTLTNPDPGSTYRVRVQGICGGYNTTSDFSTWQSLTIPAKKPAQEPDCQDCGCQTASQEPAITNFTLRNDLKPGDTIQTASGSSRFILKSVTPQGNGVYSGQFLFWVELWKLKILCNYTGLKVNTGNQIVDMDFESVYDPKFLVDVDATKDYLNQLGGAVDVLWDAVSGLVDKLYEDMKSGNDINKYVDYYVNGMTNMYTNLDFSKIPDYKDLSPEEIEQVKQEWIGFFNSDKYKEQFAENLKEAKETELSKEIVTQNVRQDLVAAEQKIKPNFIVPETLYATKSCQSLISKVTSDGEWTNLKNILIVLANDYSAGRNGDYGKYSEFIKNNQIQGRVSLHYRATSNMSYYTYYCIDNMIISWLNSSKKTIDLTKRTVSGNNDEAYVIFDDVLKITFKEDNHKSREIADYFNDAFTKLNDTRLINSSAFVVKEDDLNENQRKAIEYFLNTPEGYDFVKQFAKKGDVDMNGKPFIEDGTFYKAHGIGLIIHNGGDLNTSSFDSYLKVSKNHFIINLATQGFGFDPYYDTNLLSALFHECFIHGALSIKKYAGEKITLDDHEYMTGELLRDYEGKKFSDIKGEKYEIWPLKTFEILKAYLKGRNIPDSKIQDVILNFVGSNARVNDKNIIYDKRKN